MKGKKVIAILIMMSMLVSFSGCGKKPDTPSEAKPAENEELSGTVVVWSWDVALKSLQATAENFKKKYPKVEFQFEDMGTDQVYDKLTTGLASGGIGLPDVASVEGERVATFAAKFPKGFADVSSEVNKSDYIPVKISEVTVNGKTVAFPWDGAPAGVFYRKDLFDKAGIKAEDIKTWDDFIEAGKKMDKIGVKMAPLAMSKDDTIYRLILNEYGTFYFDKDGKTVLNSDASVKAMSIVKKMYDSKITFDNTNWDGLVTATKSGKIATVPNAVWWAGTLQDECKDQSGKWAVMKLPAVENGKAQSGVNGGSELVVPEASKNKKAAIEFAKFATSDKESLIKGFSDFGLYPSYIPCYSDPIFDKELEYFGGQKVWKFFAELGKEVPDLNFTENFAEAHTFVVDAQAKITLKGNDVKATMDELQKNVVNKFGK